MLMNVTEQHRPQIDLGLQQLQQGRPIVEGNGIKTGIPDGHRWMVQRHQQGAARRAARTC